MNAWNGIGQSRGFNIFIDSVIVIFVCLLIVNKLAPPHMNADVLMNSIMSLQKVTLFYWGQDRLLNVLPFVLSAVRSPRLNVYLCLILSGLCFCFLVWIWARGIAKSFEEVQNRHAFRRAIFLITCLLFVVVLKPAELFDVTVGHIEYSLSYALFAWIVFDLALEAEFKPLDYGRMIVFILLSTGLNNSLVIPACCAFCAIAWMKRKVSAQLLLFVLASLVSFEIWSVVSSSYPPPAAPYSAFYVADMVEYSDTSAHSVLGGLNLPRLFAVIAIVIGLRLLKFNFPSYIKAGEIANWDEICGLFSVFCIAWFLAFSVNSWIKANLFAFRYFVPIVFIGVGILSIKFAEYVLLLRPAMQNGLSVAATIILGSVLVAKFTPFEKYPVFEQVAQSRSVGADGYAGNYWYAWPAVLRDLIAHKQAVGFANRAVSNRQAIARQFSPNRHPDGTMKVVCYAAAPDTCLSQIHELLPDYELSGTSPLDAQSSILLLTRASHGGESAANWEMMRPDFHWNEVLHA